MNYITAEQFLSQSERVQMILLEWWKPSYGDLYSYITAASTRKVRCILDDYYIDYLKDNKYEGYIPLFAETQLRQFIEEKISGKIEAAYSNHSYAIFVSHKDCSFDTECMKAYELSTDDLLQAYWKVAIQIAS